MVFKSYTYVRDNPKETADLSPYIISSKTFFHNLPHGANLVRQLNIHFSISNAQQFELLLCFDNLLCPQRPHQSYSLTHQMNHICTFHQEG